MSTDFYVVCKCGVYRTLGVARARGFFIDTQGGEDNVGTFLVRHCGCGGFETTTDPSEGAVDVDPEYGDAKDPLGRGLAPD